MTYHVEAGDGEGGGAGHDGGRLSTTCRETRLHSAVSTSSRQPGTLSLHHTFHRLPMEMSLKNIESNIEKIQI